MRQQKTCSGSRDPLRRESQGSCCGAAMRRSPRVRLQAAPALPMVRCLPSRNLGGISSRQGRAGAIAAKLKAIGDGLDIWLTTRASSSEPAARPDDSYQTRRSPAFQVRQSPRPRRGRHWHRQDGHPSDHGRGFSDPGVPVFSADVKGDLVGHCQIGEPNEKLARSAPSSMLGLTISGVPGRLLGSVWREGPSGQDDRLRDRTGAVVPDDEPQRGERRRPVGLVPLADTEGLLLLDLEICRRCLPTSARMPSAQRPLGNVPPFDRGDPADAADSGGAGRRELLRRAGAEDLGHDAHRPGRAGRHQHSRRRQADDEPAALRDLPALAAVGAVRGAARSRRSRKAAPGLLLRRGASAVRRCAEAPRRPGRAGRAADPLEGRRRLFRHAESRSTSPKRFSPSSATASSTRCAPTRRASRRP